MIGDLTHRVTLQAVTRTPDGGGGFTESWSDLADAPTVYAAIRPLSGAEVFRFRQVSTEATHRIVIRYRADLTPARRIVHASDVYDIVSVVDADGRREFLDITAILR